MISINIIFAASNAAVINVAMHEVKDYNQALTANYLAQKNDPELESVFSEFIHNVKTDSIMNLIINNYKEDPVPAEADEDPSSDATIRTTPSAFVL